MMVFGRLRRWFVATFLEADRRILVLALARMADSFGNSFLIVVLPLYITTGPVDIAPVLGVTIPVLGISLTEALLVGIVLSLYGFLSSAGQPLAGRMSDRVGRRKAFILLGLALLGGANVAYAFATDYWMLIALRAVQGVSAALTIPCSVALINDLGGTTDRGGNFGIYNTFRLVGFGFGPVVAGVIVEGGPYVLSMAGRVVDLGRFDAVFLLAGLSAAVSFGFVAALVADPERTQASAADDLSMQVFDSEGRQLLDPVFAVGVATLFMAVGLGLFETLAAPINARLEQGGTLFAIEFAAGVIANVLFQTPIGQASDRYGRRPFLLAGFVILVPSTLGQGLVLVFAESIPFGPAFMIVTRFVQGIAIALVFAPGLSLGGDLAGEGESGTRLSVLTTAFSLGVAIGPLTSGLLVRFGVVWPFAFGAGLGLLGLVIVYTQVYETVENTTTIRPRAAPQDDD